MIWNIIFFEIEHAKKKSSSKRKKKMKEDNSINIIIIFYFTNGYLVGKFYLLILFTSSFINVGC